MKNWFTTIALCLAFGNIMAQSIDERLGTAMNAGDWPAVRTLYRTEGKDLQTPFMKPLSEFFISHFYNIPDSAIVRGYELLQQYQTDLGGSVSSVIILLTEDLAKQNNYEAAHALMKQYNDAVEGSGVQADRTYENLYKALQMAGGLTIERPAQTDSIPFTYQSGNRTRPVMLFVSGRVNGREVKMNFDTGAGVNIMSPETARQTGARMIADDGLNIQGVDKVKSQVAIVDSLHLGGLTYRNVPFYIVDFKTSNDSADAKIKELGYNCVIGSELMLPLGEVQFDFTNSKIIIPTALSDKPSFAPNMYRSGSHQLLVSCKDGWTGKNILMNLDTGASDYSLNHQYFEAQKQLFAGEIATDSVRAAGIGGVRITKVYRRDWPYEIGSATGVAPAMPVGTSGDEVEYDGAIGLPLMTSYSKMVINFKDMWMDLIP